MKISALLISAILAFSFLIMLSCERDECNPFIQIANNSESDIYLSTFATGSDGQCGSDSELILAGEQFDYKKSRGCIEKNGLTGGAAVFYLVADDGLYEGPRYSCDSIFILNDVLEEYILTVADLKAMDFIVNYP